MILSNHMSCATLLLACCCYLAKAQIDVLPANIDPRSVSRGVCTPETSSSARAQLKDEVAQVVKSTLLRQLKGPGVYRHFPASSCADIYPVHPSGYYWLNTTNGPHLIYCSLNENRCCNESDGKWMRIAYLNMSDPSTRCPDGWREVQSPIRTCRRQINASINSVNYTSYGIPYSRICGRIIAHQFGTPEGFLSFNQQNQATVIDGAYVDGISITFGHPREHVWTFAAARQEERWCPCARSGVAVPPFVNGDYFCEIGRESPDIDFITGNPLWDGQGCADSSSCCEFNNPPWFCKQLGQTTTESIEVRVMSNVTGQNRLEDEDTPVQLIEIFVQ